MVEELFSTKVPPTKRMAMHVFPTPEIGKEEKSKRKRKKKMTERGRGREYE